MPVIRQAWITRDDLRLNRNRVYVFGDNMVRQGYGGQAMAMRGEPNAFGIATKWTPDNRAEAFFRDDDLDDPLFMLALLSAFSHLSEVLENGHDVVIPTDGLGTGLSRLPEKAPKIAALLDDNIAKLEEKYGTISSDNLS